MLAALLYATLYFNFEFLKRVFTQLRAIMATTIVAKSKSGRNKFATREDHNFLEIY
jgi:hypothetical protein